MRLRGLLPLVLVAPVLAGCGTASLGTGKDFSVESALGSLPDVVARDDGGDGRPLRVVVGDLRALQGGASAADEPPDRWLAPLRRAGVTGLLPDELAVGRLGSGEVRDVLGFDARDVVSYAAVEDAPDALAVLSLADGAGLTKGVKATGDGEPGDRAGSAAFPVVLGTGSRGGQVALGRSADVLVDWADKGDTLADEDALATVARALDGHDVVAAELLAPPPGGDGAVGAGQQVRDGRVTTWIACASDDPRAVAADVRRTWRADPELAAAARLGPVTTGDGVVLVGLEPRADPGAVLDLLQRGELPFVTPTEED